MGTKKLWKDGLMWGAILWLIGYVLGIIFFMMKIPPTILGWAIMPIGILISLWVLLKGIKGGSMKYYLAIAVVWTAIAVVLDYLLNFKLFNIANYYKLDIYIYYAFTFILPLIVGLVKNKKLK